MDSPSRVQERVAADHGQLCYHGLRVALLKHVERVAAGRGLGTLLRVAAVFGLHEFIASR